MESLVALSTKYKELTKKYSYKSQPSSSSKNKKCKKTISKSNSDIEGLRKFYSADNVNALEKKFEQLSNSIIMMHLIDDRITEKGYLAKTATIRLAKEVN